MATGDFQTAAQSGDARQVPLEAIEEYWQHDRSWDSAAETNADKT